MKRIMGVGLACVALAVGGCATRASGVAPVAVSSSDYAGMACGKQREELSLARQREEILRKKQNNAATFDAAAVFLFALPLGSVLGQDVEGDLAQAKGEVLALERSIKANCGG